MPTRIDDDAWHVRRGELSSQQAQELIAALNAELSAAYPEAGATHFRLDPTEVSAPANERISVAIPGGTLECELRGSGTPVLLLSGCPGFSNYMQPLAELRRTIEPLLRRFCRGCRPMP